MTPLEREILIGVLALREQFLRRDWKGEGVPNRGTWRIEIQNARDGLVSTSGAPWNNGLDEAGRKAVSRAYASLAAHGLIIRHGDERTSFLSLTEQGEQLARKLAEREQTR
jgi:hypothetical protein